MKQDNETASLPGTEQPQYEKGGGRSFEKDISAWPRLKIARAIQHRMDLEARIAVWAAGKPLIWEKVFTEDRLRWQVKMRVTTPPPLLEWSLILGDCYHSLRGALDACVWELAHFDGAVPPKRHALQFPILTDKRKWAKARREQLQTVPDEAADRIELMQPFNRPADEVGRDALICLSRLNNIDKHRQNIAVNIVCDQIQTHLRITWKSAEATARNIPPRVIYYTPELVDGTTIMEVGSYDPIVKAEGCCSVRYVFTVETPTGRQELFIVTPGLMQYVQQTVDGLLGGLVKEDDLAGSPSEPGGDWIQMNFKQEGDAYRSVSDSEAG